jgi:hypothetical protein
MSKYVETCYSHNRTYSMDTINEAVLIKQC